MQVLSGDNSLFKFMLVKSKIEGLQKTQQTWLRANRQDREGCLEHQEVLDRLEQLLSEWESLFARHNKRESVDLPLKEFIENVESEYGIKIP